MTAQQQFEADGAQQWLINYPLDSASVVFDVGGYHGEWTNELVTARDHGICSQCGGRQNPYVYIFEPVPEFALHCRQRFRDYPKIDVCEFGLGNRARRENFTLNESATTLFDRRNSEQCVEIADVHEFVVARNIQHIELISINVEGMEYELLHRMIESGVAAICRNIQVQFHAIDTWSVAERRRLTRELAKTHDLAWEYPFVWESWRRK